LVQALLDVDYFGLHSFQDELLAKFVVNSHIKHHPNKKLDDEDEDVEMVCDLTSSLCGKILVARRCS
jgi:hypothetical protein